MSFEKVYYDPSHPAGYAGARRLINKENKSDEVYDWLTQQDAYTIHKPVRRRFPRLFYNVTNIDDVWEADLVDLRSLRSYNDNVSYLLTVIDVLSKYAWVEPLQDKTVHAVKEAFTRIFERSDDRLPVCLQTDKGKEFVGKELQTFLKKSDINFRVTRNPDIKAAIVERFNRTLKERMWRYFTHRNTRRYIDILQQFVHAYNHAKHSSIKMEPAAVTLYNADKALENMTNASMKQRGKRRFSMVKYKCGDYVRISRTKGTFEKGYERNWSEEIFRITKVVNRQGIRVYELHDLEGELIDGFFYTEEITPVHEKRMIQNQEFKIDRVLRTKGRGAKKQLFVSWVGYPSKFNSWIPASNAHNLGA